MGIWFIYLFILIFGRGWEFVIVVGRGPLIFLMFWVGLFSSYLYNFWEMIYIMNLYIDFLCVLIMWISTSIYSFKKIVILYELIL